MRTKMVLKLRTEQVLSKLSLLLTNLLNWFQLLDKLKLLSRLQLLTSLTLSLQDRLLIQEMVNLLLWNIRPLD